MESNQLIEHTFRHESGRIVAWLSKKYGTTELMEIEDAVSDALLAGLKSWSYSKTPDDPAAWLSKVAERKLLDKLKRKQKYYQDIVPKIVQDEEEKPQSELDLIRLMLWCAHEDVSYRDQIALMLKLVSGFSNKEIATALIMTHESVKKRIQRAKNKIVKKENHIELPLVKDVPNRFSSLRKAIYLIFNEGYFSLNDNNTVREDLIYEGLRLGKVLSDIEHSKSHVTYALVSLMLYHTSRLNARFTKDDAIILLEDQDRSLWDHGLINLANTYLGKAMKAQQLSEYHIEASIAAVHANSKYYENTDWNFISGLYKTLTEAISNPIAFMNYAFALLQAGKIDLAYEVLNDIDDNSLHQQQYLYFATMANYFVLKDNHQEASHYLWKAIDSCNNDKVRTVLKKRLVNMN